MIRKARGNFDFIGINTSSFEIAPTTASPEFQRDTHDTAGIIEQEHHKDALNCVKTASSSSSRFAARASLLASFSVVSRSCSLK